MRIKVVKGRLPGLLLIQPTVFRDERGEFVETWSERDFREAGIAARFVQDNQSRSRRGVLRGLHFQPLHPQGKLVRLVQGESFSVAVDLRGGAPTFGLWQGIRLSWEEHNQLYIPPGFAHGFLALSETVVHCYKCTDFYHPEDETGIRWDDPTIGIEWPDLGSAPIQSMKDAALPFFDKRREYYRADGRAR